MGILRSYWQWIVEHIGSGAAPSEAPPAGPFGWDGIVAAYGVFDIGDKINEAKFFLQAMERETDIDRFRWSTSACLEACRACLDWLAWSVASGTETEDGNTGPDVDAIEALEPYFTIDLRQLGKGKVFASPVHPILREMATHRRDTAHRGPLWIDRHEAREGENVQLPGDVFVFVDSVPGAPIVADAVPGCRVVGFCRGIIRVIEEAQEVAYS